MILSETCLHGLVMLQDKSYVIPSCISIRVGMLHSYLSTLFLIYFTIMSTQLMRIDSTSLPREDHKPLSCKATLKMLTTYFDFTFPDYKNVIFDRRNRCHSLYFRRNKKWRKYRSGRGSHYWTFEEVKELVEEILIVIEKQTRLGITKMFPIRSGEKYFRLSLSWYKDQIYIQCGRLRHPFDVVATILHEAAHQMVFRIPHHGQCTRDASGHCPVWQRCAKVITALFAKAPKSSHFLSLLKREYGVEWERCIVQAKRSCTGCKKTAYECSVEARIAEDKTEIQYGILYTSMQTDMMAVMKDRQLRKKKWGGGGRRRTCHHHC